MSIARPFRADQVGSYLRPDEIVVARRKHEAGEIDAKQLRDVEDQCIRDLVRMQEDLGLEAITDGEFRRRSWNKDFLAGFKNVTTMPGTLQLFHKNPDGSSAGNQITAWKVEGKVGRKGPIQVDDFKFLAAATKKTPKTCIPSPTLLHFRGGRKAIDEKTYPDMQGFFTDVARTYQEEIADLAAAGARYVQLDDTNFAYLCDSKFREASARNGEDPAKLVSTYCKLVNDSISKKPAGMLTGIHLCRGNSSTGGAASGGYEPVAEQLFTTMDVDAFFLEYDDARSGDFSPLRFVPKGKYVVLGLVTTKRAELETRDQLKRRIDEAAKYVPLEYLAISPQCGFSSGVKERRRIEINDEMAKIRVLVETARDVWGGL